MSTRQSEGNMAERNKEAMRRIVLEGFGEGKLQVFDELFAPDFREHQVITGLPPGVEGLKARVRGLHAVMPDLTYTIQDMAAVGDKVWSYFVARGTHRGEFFGVPGTGKVVTIDVMDLTRFENGKVVEHWGVPDRFGMLEQLGLLPSPRQQAAGRAGGQ